MPDLGLAGSRLWGAQTGDAPGSGSRLYYVNRWAVDWATDVPWQISEGDLSQAQDDNSDSDDRDSDDMEDA
jgi:hypothetical protein